MSVFDKSSRLATTLLSVTSFSSRCTRAPEPSRRSIPLALSAAVLAAGLILGGCDREAPAVKRDRLMKEAAEFVKADKLEEARLKLQSAIDADPKSAQAHYEFAEVLLKQKKIGPAVENYRSAINLDPKHRDARYHLAAILVGAQEWEQAEDHIKKLMEFAPEDAEVLVLKANLEASSPRKNIAEAKQILQGVLAKDERNGAALASLGGLSLMEGKLAEAEAQFTKALAISPNNAPVQMVLADLYARQGRLDEAQSVVEGLVKENPKNSSLRFGFGEFLLKRGAGDKALAQYEEILKNDPIRHDARDRLYDMYVTRGEEAKVRKLVDDLARALPDNPGVSYFRGRQKEQVGQLKEALDLYLKAVQGIPGFAPAFRRAGLLELQLGDERTGLEHLNQAVTIDPGDVGARLALARIALAKRETAQASEHVTQVLQRFPQQLGANVLRADIALIDGKIEEARKVYQFLIDNFPKVSLGYLKLGLLEERAKNPERALELYGKALAFDTNVLIPLQRYVVLYNAKNGIEKTLAEMNRLLAESKQSKPEYKLVLGTLSLGNRNDPNRKTKARTLLNEAVEERPTLVAGYFALAALDSEAGNLDDAAANYEKLITKNPKHIPSLMLLALTRERQGKFDKAAESYRKALELDPRFGPAANNLAWLLADKLNGDLDEALKLAEAAKQVIPNDPSVADTLGWVHFKRGTPRAALPFLEEAVELERKAGNETPNPEIIAHLAEVKIAVGEKEQAKQLITEALQSIPANAPLRPRLEELSQKAG